MNIQPDAQTTDAADKPKEQVELRSKELLAAVERCRDRWADRAYYLEEISKYSEDTLAQIMRMQAKTIRTCISEIWQETEEANNRIS